MGCRMCDKQGPLKTIQKLARCMVHLWYVPFSLRITVFAEKAFFAAPLKKHILIYSPHPPENMGNPGHRHFRISKPDRPPYHQGHQLQTTTAWRMQSLRCQKHVGAVRKRQHLSQHPTCVPFRHRTLRPAAYRRS